MGSACWDRAVPNGEMPGGLQKVPTELTLIGRPKDVHLVQIHVANDTDFDAWLYVCDCDGDAVIPHVVIKAHTYFREAWDHGLKCDGGVQWQASQEGLTGEIFGYQEIFTAEELKENG